MKVRVGAVILILIVIFTAGCITKVSNDNTISSSSGKKMGHLEVYIMIEEKNAAFEIATFHLDFMGMGITEFERPYLVLKGGYMQSKFEKGITVKLSFEGRAENWEKLQFPFNGTIEYVLHSPGRYVIMLEPIHVPGRFTLKIDERKSGRVGVEVPEDIFGSDEEILIKEASELGELYSKKLTNELKKNRELKDYYFGLWEKTGNLSYLQIYRDLGYAIRSFGNLAKERRLNKVEMNILLMNLRANNFYYSTYKKPGRKDLTLVFGNSSPYYGTIRVKNSPMHSELPFVYYRARGFNMYFVAALHWAHIYYGKGDYREMLEILNELRKYIQYGEYNNRTYALFKNYFQFQNASIPWVSGYAQGLAAGLYAKAYNLTGNESYLKLATEFLNSFDLPLSENGFVVETKYGPWYLEYNYYPKELVLNGHIIALQGLYYYWEVSGKETAWKLFWDGAMSVKNALPYFDTGSWSRYASIYNSSSVFYHRLHIRLLVWLYEKTGDKTFLKYAEKWNSYLRRKGLKPEKIEISQKPGETSGEQG